MWLGAVVCVRSGICDWIWNSRGLLPPWSALTAVSKIELGLRVGVAKGGFSAFPVTRTEAEVKIAMGDNVQRVYGATGIAGLFTRSQLSTSRNLNQHGPLWKCPSLPHLQTSQE